MEFEFSSHNFENPQISNFIKSVQWEPNCSMWMDGQTGMTKLIVTFPNFTNAPKNIRRGNNAKQISV